MTTVGGEGLCCQMPVTHLTRCSSSDPAAPSGHAPPRGKTGGPPLRPSLNRHGGRAALATIERGGDGRSPLHGTGLANPDTHLFWCWPYVQSDCGPPPYSQADSMPRVSSLSKHDEWTKSRPSKPPCQALIDSRKDGPQFSRFARGDDSPRHSGRVRHVCPAGQSGQ